MMLEDRKASQKKYIEQASVLSGHFESRRHWEDRDDEREKQREESLSVKDKEREIEAIKVSCVSQYGIV